MALVTRDELKTTLGIGDLYSNDVIDQVIGSADDIILSVLVRYKAQVISVCCQESVAPPAVGTVIRFRVKAPHLFQVGQRISFGQFPIAYCNGRELDFL